MPSKITWATVRQMGLELPGAEKGLTYRSPSLKIRGNWFVVVPTHRSAEPRSIAVRISFRDRDELIAADPDTFYLKEHYVSSPCVLVRLDCVHRDALRDLLKMAFDFACRKPGK